MLTEFSLWHWSGDLTVAAQLLQTFGDIKVLSSPKVMTLNNQTAVFKGREQSGLFPDFPDELNDHGVWYSTRHT